MTFRERIARALYDSNKFVRPWDHPRSQQVWRDTMFRYADAVIAEIKEEARRQMEKGMLKRSLSQEKPE